MAKPRKNTLLKEAKQARRLAEHRRGYAEMASAMGVSHLMAKLPDKIKKWLLEMPVTEPGVMPDAPSAGRKSADAIRTSLTRALREATTTLENGVTCPVTHVMTYGWGILNCFMTILVDPAWPTELRKLAAEGKALAEKFQHQEMASSVIPLVGELLGAAAAHHRIDKQLISFTIDRQNTPSGRARVVVAFTLTEPQECQVEIEANRRRVFRCGGNRGPHVPLVWVEWPEDLAGVNPKGQPLQVWVQSHALRRMEERLKSLGTDQTHFWMWESLREPEIVSREGDSFTVAYHYLHHRLGYLLVRRIDDMLVVTTFLFLTMNGTPEARMLYDALRLRRSEIEYQHLDSLTTFTHTDLLDDPDLLAIFRQCGCGHLAELRAGSGKQCNAYAAELRKYLRLDEEKYRNILSARMGLNLQAASTRDEDDEMKPDADVARAA